MKNNYSIAERNRIVEEHLWCIDRVIRKNRSLMRAARLDYDDVYQQLSIRLIRAVAGFDPQKGKLKQHIFAQLRFELLIPYVWYDRPARRLPRQKNHLDRGLLGTTQRSGARWLLPVGVRWMCSQ